MELRVTWTFRAFNETVKLSLHFELHNLAEITTSSSEIKTLHVVSSTYILLLYFLIKNAIYWDVTPYDSF
jgi:hypothetical protein